MLDFSQHTILVTGASAGIGRQTATLLAELGATVVLSGRDEGKLTAVKTALPNSDAHHVCPFDLRAIDDIPNWLKSVQQSHGHLHGLVHCAGLQETHSVRQFDLAKFDRIMHTNLASGFALCRGFRAQRDKTRTGAIVMVASIAGFIGQPGNTIYGASKAGLMSLTRGMAMELLRDNIRVNAVAPALINTDMLTQTQASMTSAQFDQIQARHPMGIGEPEDVANAVAFLLSDAAKWINAVCLPVDGGHMAN